LIDFSHFSMKSGQQPVQKHSFSSFSHRLTPFKCSL